jgi:hypothetical protein
MTQMSALFFWNTLPLPAVPGINYLTINSRVNLDLRQLLAHIILELPQARLKMTESPRLIKPTVQAFPHGFTNRYVLEMNSPEAVSDTSYH